MTPSLVYPAFDLSIVNSAGFRARALQEARTKRARINHLREELRASRGLKGEGARRLRWQLRRAIREHGRAARLLEGDAASRLQWFAEALRRYLSGHPSPDARLARFRAPRVSHKAEGIELRWGLIDEEVEEGSRL